MRDAPIAGGHPVTQVTTVTVPDLEAALARVRAAGGLRFGVVRADPAAAVGA